jgi:hypothetical protein
MRINDAILALNPNITVIRGDVAYDADGNLVQYDKAQAEALVQANAYKAQRAAEYPSIGDQLDALWKGGAEAEAMLAKVQAVKQKYPKGVA